MRVLFFLLLSITAIGQDITITTKDWNIDGTKYKPGDRLILQGPTRSYIEFHNLKGTAANPIVITATDKLLIARKMDGGRTVQFFDCDYVRFTGTDNNLIEITGGGHGVTVSNNSNHPELDHLYIHHVGYSGIDITNYPTCDPKTWRGAAPDMYDIFVHDNKITDMTDGEAIYIGASHYYKTFDIACIGSVKPLEPGTGNVQVYNNTIERIGANGIQVGGAIGGTHIHHNTLIDTGKKGVINQMSSIEINPGSVAVVEDNLIDGCNDFAISLQGRTEGTVVRRNIIKKTKGALFTVARESFDKGTFQVYENKFTQILPSVGGYGVEAYTNTDFQNNVLEMVKGTPFRTYNGAKINTAPRIVTEPGTITVETTGTVSDVYVITPSGKRIKLN